MLGIIRSLPVMLYFTFKGFFKDLKKDERGLSGVVVAILLILIAVLAILLIWTFLGEWLEALWTRIQSQGDTIT